METPQSPAGVSNTSALNQFEERLALYLVKKAPALPAGFKNFLVAVAPWASLIGLLLTLPVVLLALGVGAAIMPFGMMGDVAMGMQYGTQLTISVTVLAIVLALYALAIPGLFKRARNG